MCYNNQKVPFIQNNTTGKLVNPIQLFYAVIEINYRGFDSMNLEQIEAFVYISFTGSFSKAAELLYTSQPSISAKVKALEKELNSTLFERTSQSIYLSEEGKTFLPYAQNMLDNLHKGKVAIKNTNSTLVEGEVHISVVFSGTEHFLPRIVSEFNQRYPNIKLVVHADHSNQVLNMVLNNDVLIGIVRSISHPRIETIPLEEDNVVLVFHQHHPLNAYQYVNIQELASLPLILFKRETIDWMLINNAVKKANIHPNIIMEIDSIEGAKQMVKKNLGISFLPRFAVKEELQKGELKTVPVDGIPSIQRNFELIFVKGQELDQATEVFRRFLADKLL